MTAATTTWANAGVPLVAALIGALGGASSGVFGEPRRWPGARCDSREASG
jgi:hypothetical protein